MEPRSRSEKSDDHAPARRPRRRRRLADAILQSLALTVGAAVVGLAVGVFDVRPGAPDRGHLLAILGGLCVLLGLAIVALARRRRR